MKIFGRGIPVRQRTVVLFLFAVLLPSCVLGYLGFRTFHQRRESLRRVLESNLAVSADAALRSIEAAFFEDERRALEAAPFRCPLEADPAFPDGCPRTDGSGRRYFLLDEAFRIRWPRTGAIEEADPGGASPPNADDSLEQDLRRAENLEFAKKDGPRAAAAYRRCLSSPLTGGLLARALAGLGRCLLAQNSFDEASRVYRDLASRCGGLLDEAGHPYGITAAFQLSEIHRRRGNGGESLRVLLDAYRDLRQGRRPLGLATYRFFSAEIETAFSDGRIPETFSDLLHEFQTARGGASLYEEDLVFSEFLRDAVIRPLREKLASGRLGEDSARNRFLVGTGEQSRLVAFTNLENLRPGRAFTGGYCVELASLAKSGPAGTALKAGDPTGVLAQVIDESGRDVSTGRAANALDGSLTLSLRRYPLPWRFVFSQPELGALRRSAARENVLYGLLLGVIGALMLLGALLLARDISRDAESTRLKTEFVQTISHELKTPLTLIRLYGETLQRQERLGEKERQGAYEIITKESERLSHLIDNVLDFSRIEMGRKEFVFRKGDLAETVRATLESYRYHLEKKGFAVKADLAPSLPEATFDQEAVASVLVNLLSNAMKFSPGAKEVAVRLRRDGSRAVVEVEDKGLGIPPEEMGRIFQKFYRASEKSGTETTGSGLGLTIVKHIVEAHGGRIEVKSEPGKGSVFSVILPLQGPEKDAP